MSNCLFVTRVPRLTMHESRVEYFCHNATVGSEVSDPVTLNNEFMVC